MLSLFGQGFVDEADDVVADEASLAIEAEYPSCRVLPISKMTIDQAAVDEGEAVALSATFVVRNAGHKKYLLSLRQKCICTKMARKGSAGY